MKLLKTLKGNQFISLNENLETRVVKKLILNSDVCISDFDDTDAESYAKKIAFNGLPFRLLDPKYAKWFFQASLDYWNKGKESQHESWQSYVFLFLDKKAREKIKSELTKSKVSKIFYPGVQELYKILKENEVCTAYISRNIFEVIQVFTKVLEVDEFYAEAFDKADVMARFVENNPRLKKYFVKGDSVEDEELLDVLKFYISTGKLETLISCYNASNKKNINENFDINVYDNYIPLIHILKDKVLVEVD